MGYKICMAGLECSDLELCHWGNLCCPGAQHCSSTVTMAGERGLAFSLRLHGHAGNASAPSLGAEVALAPSYGLTAPLAYGPLPAQRAAYAAQGPSIAPANSYGLSAPLAYGPSPAQKAAYAAQGPSLASAYVPASAPAPAPQPALTVEPALAPSLLTEARPSHVVPAAYAPGPAPEVEPELGVPSLSLPAPVSAPAISYGSVPAYSGASAPSSAPSPAPAAYAGSPGPASALQPRAYAPVAAPCEVWRTSHSCSVLWSFGPKLMSIHSEMAISQRHIGLTF